MEAKKPKKAPKAKKSSEKYAKDGSIVPDPTVEAPE
jgi:hypothetical protein